MNPGISIRFDTQETHKSPPHLGATASILLTSQGSRTIRGRGRSCHYRRYKGGFSTERRSIACPLFARADLAAVLINVGFVPILLQKRSEEHTSELQSHS